MDRHYLPIPEYIGTWNVCQPNNVVKGENITMLIVEVKNKDGQIITVLSANPKTFSTGSRGYHGLAKAEIDGKPYQINFQAVEIGSKTRVSGDVEAQPR